MFTTPHSIMIIIKMYHLQIFFKFINKFILVNFFKIDDFFFKNNIVYNNSETVDIRILGNPLT